MEDSKKQDVASSKNLTLDLIAVDVEQVGEAVVLLVLLELGEARRDLVGVQQADRGGRLGVLLELARRRLRHGRVVIVRYQRS